MTNYFISIVIDWKRKKKPWTLELKIILDPNHWNLIEWPEKIENLLPEENTIIEIIKNTNGSRTLKLKPVN